MAFLHVNDERTSADPVARYVDDRNPGNATLVIHSCMVGSPDTGIKLKTSCVSHFLNLMHKGVGAHLYGREIVVFRSHASAYPPQRPRIKLEPAGMNRPPGVDLPHRQISKREEDRGPSLRIRSDTKPHRKDSAPRSWRNSRNCHDTK